MLHWIFPRKCAGCRSLLEKKEQDLCARCVREWPSIGPEHCPQCSFPFRSGEAAHLCGDCLKVEKRCQRVMALGVYEGVLRSMIQRLKFRQEENLAYFLGRRLLQSLPESGWDLMLPVPMTKQRLQERGYNQSWEVVKVMAKAGGMETDPYLLQKIRETPPQTSLSGDARRNNVRGVFFVEDPPAVKDKRVLIVDDVYTTGATVEALAAILMGAGAVEVQAAVLARAGGDV